MTLPAGVQAADGREQGVEIAHPGTAAPGEPVMAYVHDADRGEVTIMSGTTQTTYRDRALVERLLKTTAPKGR